ncbi:aspartate-alanine antiporter [Acinetobacter haemolyticus]|uniref:Aspartate-alanine antiporter n=1 Tax=Acinetobacter haemolyticus TaxID=29430 RepID=A0A6A8BAW8_ACIHA|nr:aspartate-alanine antiporter [Acinetobacter haemolyticus]MQZ30784.1 aspartate-alanine antiporter [Acinetobacter haemolyticus]QHI09297.1 aspartate-alanine antiporter [Acinetobacter haemolyticus]QHI12557.1 aspartate-alanine antiporter [Acinetobacter haemolyticus]
MIETIQNELRHSPEILLFLSLAIGFWIGQFQFGKFQFGGVAGSLLVAVLLSLLGVPIDNGVKAILFALFIYAVGFESGPQFFKSLGPESIKEILLAVFMAVTGLITVLIMAKLFNLDKGLAAGMAAGGMTQSAIIGTAGDALSRLDLPLQEIQRLQANVAIGYAVTYIFGSLGAIIVCVNILPRFMGREIRDDALKAQSEKLKGAFELAPGQELAMPEIVGRIYKVEHIDGQKVSELESKVSGITLERLKRKNQLVDIRPDTILQTDDIVLVVGRRAAVIQVADLIGTELQSSQGMEMIMDTTDIILTNTKYTNRSLGDIKTNTPSDLKHGIYVLGIQRNGEQQPLNDETILKQGDRITVYGTESDLKRLIKEGGQALPESLKTDWIFHGAGLVVGLLIGLIVVRVGGVPLTLGAGGGALLSGLIFGWLRSRHQVHGNMPAAASQLLKDLGLAGFVAAVGLQSGLQAIQTIKESGLSLFMIGVVVTLVPLILSMFFARYVLKYTNVAVMAGAISGARSANPAFGGVLDKAGNSIPTVPFAITYALANVFLTLLGPLIVGLA